MWFAGIDWADTHHDALVIDEMGHQVGSVRVAHTKAGLDDLKRFLLDIAKTVDQLACMVETSHGLLIAALLEAGFTVYPVNPKTVDRRRNAAGVKTDTIDAYLLAKTGRADLTDLRKLQPDAPMVAELKLLTRDQDGLIQSQTRLAESAHGLPQNVLSRCPHPVLQTAPALDIELLANLSDPTSRHGGFGRRDRNALEPRASSSSRRGGKPHCPTAASTASDS